MNDQAILQKAIQKAIDGGWKPKYLDDYKDIRGSVRKITGNVVQFTKGLSDYRAIIFNHDFAKALWGEPRQKTNEELKAENYPGKYPAGGILGGGVWTLDWKHHLQQMVIADDPIKYLGDNI